MFGDSTKSCKSNEVFQGTPGEGRLGTTKVRSLQKVIFNQKENFFWLKSLLYSTDFTNLIKNHKLFMIFTETNNNHKHVSQCPSLLST